VALARQENTSGQLPGQLSWWATGPPQGLRAPRSPAVPACRVTGMLAEGSARPSPCVLLVSRAGDAELDAVASALGKVGIGCLRLDADSAGSVRLLADLGTGILIADEHRVLPTVTWVRHFSGRAIRAQGTGVGDMFLRDSWQALVTQLRAVSRAVVPAPATGYLEQLRIAATLGVSVPRTVAVSDLRLARAAIGAPRLVIKAMAGHFIEATPGFLTGVYPVVVDSAVLDTPWRQPAAPVLVQEFVTHDAELRVYYVRGEIYCFSVDKAAPSDLWLEPGRVRVTALRPPPAVRRATRAIARALGLDYAAFDFLMRGKEPVFLEANQDGDWRWAESRAGTAEVTMAVARMLRDLHREHAPQAHDGAPGPPAGFDLVRFLA
jgi:hypothetical protein